MKKRKVSPFLFRVISVIPLLAMFAALGLAYVSNTGGGDVEGALSWGTANADVTWKVRLKENPFFPTKELGSEYSFIRELVDRLQFDLKFTLSDAPADAAVQIKYRVDGVLRANHESSDNGLLLMQEYPKLAEGTAELSEKAADAVRAFELSLTPYTYKIESFQSAYRVSVASRMDLNINIDAVMESGGESLARSVPLHLTIPLDSSVFQISGSPSDKMEFSMPVQAAAPAGGTYATTLYFLGAAVLMLLIAIAVFLFFSPPVPEPEMTMLKQAMTKCKGSLVTIKANPRDAGLPMLPVADIDGLVNISESTGQPVLHYSKKDDHLFLVSSDEILYSYELRAVGQADPGQAPAQGKAAL